MKRLARVLVTAVFIVRLGTAYGEVKIPTSPGTTPPPKTPTTTPGPKQPTTPTAGPNTPGGPKVPTPGGPKLPPTVSPQTPPVKQPNQPLPPGSRACSSSWNPRWVGMCEYDTKEKCEAQYATAWCTCECGLNCHKPGQRELSTISSNQPCQWFSRGTRMCEQKQLGQGSNPSFSSACQAGCRAACGMARY